MPDVSRKKQKERVMDRKRACLCVVMLSCCFCAIAALDAASQTKPKADGQEKTFKVKTELVEIHAVVTDRQGHVIENLKKDDFELLENNQPQETSFFSVLRVEDESGRPATSNSRRSGARSARGRCRCVS